MTGEQIWVQGKVESVYNDGHDTWLSISPDSPDGFEFRIDGESKEVPFDREFWEKHIGKNVTMSMRVVVDE